MSVKVVTKVPEATAGSIPFFVNITGINAPKNEPKIKFKKREIEMIILSE